jgi:hypothetical protein
MVSQTGWLRAGSGAFPKYPFRHPHRRHEDVCWIGEKRGLVAFDEMSQPSERKSGGNQKEGDDPVKPHHNDRRESDRDRNQVQGAFTG